MGSFLKKAPQAPQKLPQKDKYTQMTNGSLPTVFDEVFGILKPFFQKGFKPPEARVSL